MKVSVSRTINCAHHLPGTELHGHSYRITATVQGDYDADTGYACTFQSLSAGIANICNALDHKRLELVIGAPATAERLAVHIARAASKEMQRLVNVLIEVGDDGTVETEMHETDEGEYFDGSRW